MSHYVVLAVLVSRGPTSEFLEIGTCNALRLPELTHRKLQEYAAADWLTNSQNAIPSS